MLSVGSWGVRQKSTFEKVTDTEFQRDSSGQIVSSRSVEREIEVFAPDASATATVTNKMTQAVVAKLQLRVSPNGERPWVIDHEFVLQPAQEDEVTVRFPTQSRNITGVVVQDVFSRLVSDGK